MLSVDPLTESVEPYIMLTFVFPLTQTRVATGKPLPGQGLYFPAPSAS